MLKVESSLSWPVFDIRNLQWKVIIYATVLQIEFVLARVLSGRVPRWPRYLNPDDHLAFRALAYGYGSNRSAPRSTRHALVLLLDPPFEKLNLNAGMAATVDGMERDDHAIPLVWMTSRNTGAKHASILHHTNKPLDSVTKSDYLSLQNQGGTACNRLKTG